MYFLVETKPGFGFLAPISLILHSQQLPHWVCRGSWSWWGSQAKSNSIQTARPPSFPRSPWCLGVSHRPLYSSMPGRCSHSLHDDPKALLAISWLSASFGIHYTVSLNLNCILCISWCTLLSDEGCFLQVICSICDLRPLQT